MYIHSNEVNALVSNVAFNALAPFASLEVNKSWICALDSFFVSLTSLNMKISPKKLTIANTPKQIDTYVLSAMIGKN